MEPKILHGMSNQYFYFDRVVRWLEISPLRMIYKWMTEV
jgi:hypothetical protein